MARPILGLVGRKRTGKDTVAARLVEAHGFVRYAFADELRRAALALNPIIVPGNTPWGSYRLSEIVTADGWEKAKEDPEVRRTLQNYGVAIRELDPDFWVRLVLREVNDDPRPVVITDVRFPNEARAVEDVGGVLARVVRPGLDESDIHASETALTDYPTKFDLLNDRDVPALHRHADELVNLL
ncbi:hypothetical protein OG792_32905 [Micromonospora sp. NBC_01699]|uniref:deoxynucleotide monophosphate kinase family protein n=1 Tax=Micromonospora sp. NBC_01699 TaxID=2975984 RepID=UPI002E29DD20|nr:hypothetical protein [Micromonospora sp. NBC_01699]